MDRLRALAMQCRSFPGPLAAAVYLPLLAPGPPGGQAAGGQGGLQPQHAEELEYALVRVRALFERMEAEPGACALRLMLVYEPLEGDVLYRLIPLNALRNLASLAASTPLVFMIDADFVLSRTLHRGLADPAWLARVTTGAQERTAWVVPCFNVSMSPFNPPDMIKALVHRLVTVEPTDKLSLLESAINGTINSFGHQMHTPTNYLKWFYATEPYLVQPVGNYEPFVIVARESNPPYDERHRGYTIDKVTYHKDLIARGTALRVLHDVWMVHYPHIRHATLWLRKHALGEDNPHKFKAVQAAVIARMQQALASGAYAPATNEQFDRCRRDLPWWSGVQRQR